MERHASPSARFFGELGTAMHSPYSHGENDSMHMYASAQLPAGLTHDVLRGQNVVESSYHNRTSGVQPLYQYCHEDAANEYDDANQRQLIVDTINVARKMQGQLNAVANAMSMQNIMAQNVYPSAHLPAAQGGVVPNNNGGSGGVVMVPWIVPASMLNGYSMGNTVEQGPKDVPPFQRRKGRIPQALDWRLRGDQRQQPVVQDHSYGIPLHCNRGGYAGGNAVAAFRRNRPPGPKRGHSAPKGGGKGHGHNLPQPPASVRGPLCVFVDLSLLKRVASDDDPSGTP